MADGWLLINLTTFSRWRIIVFITLTLMMQLVTHDDTKKTLTTRTVLTESMTDWRPCCHLSIHQMSWNEEAGSETIYLQTLLLWKSMRRLNCFWKSSLPLRLIHSFIRWEREQSGNSFLAQIAMQYRNVCICITPPFERPGRVHERLSALLLALVWTTSMQFVGRTWTGDRWQVTCDRARDENHFLMLRNWNVETNQESINLFLSWNQY